MYSDDIITNQPHREWFLSMLTFALFFNILKADAGCFYCFYCKFGSFKILFSKLCWNPFSNWVKAIRSNYKLTHHNEFSPVAFERLVHPKVMLRLIFSALFIHSEYHLNAILFLCAIHHSSFKRATEWKPTLAASIMCTPVRSSLEVQKWIE